MLENEPQNDDVNNGADDREPVGDAEALYATREAEAEAPASPEVEALYAVREAEAQAAGSPVGGAEVTAEDGDEAEDAEDAEDAEAEGAGSGAAADASGDGAGSSAEPEPEAAPAKKPRRRAASRPAGPPVAQVAGAPGASADDPDAAAAAQEPGSGSDGASDSATGDAPSAAAEAEPADKPKRARKTAAKKATAKAARADVAEAAEAADAASTDAAENAASTATPEAEPAEQAADEAAPAAKKTARSRTRKKAAAEPEAAESGSGEAPEPVAAAEHTPEETVAGIATAASAPEAAPERPAASVFSNPFFSATQSAQVGGAQTGVRAAGPSTSPFAAASGTKAQRSEEQGTQSHQGGHGNQGGQGGQGGDQSRHAESAEPPAARASRADDGDGDEADEAADAVQPAGTTSRASRTRARRRAASSPAGPPRVHAEGGAGVAEPTAAADGAGAGAADAADEAAAQPTAAELEAMSPADRARAIIAARAAAPAVAAVPLFQAPDLAQAAALQKQTAKAAPEAEEEEAEEEPAAPTRRRRHRGRGRAEHDEQQAEGAAEGHEDEHDEDEDHDDEEGGSASSRRRRRRRRRASGENIELGPDDPPNTVVKVREARETTRSRQRTDRGKGAYALDDDVQGVRGSTRLEAKKQRRREGRDTGRRRAPLITEAEFLARRESVERVMVVRQAGDRTQIGVLEDGVLVEHYVNRAQSASYVGNVYLGKVQNVLPSMEAAFVDIGKGRNAVLYAGEVNFDAAGITGHAKRIESVLKSGQAVLTQVTKDPIGHKGARLTSQVSLPGRYLVYVPEGSMTGISRKLPENERARLKTILKAVVPEDAGVIVRTAAEGASEDELRRDVERLAAQWSDIQRKAASSGSSAPTLLYGEPDLTVRVVRDIFNEDFSKLIVSGDQAWDTIRDYVHGVAPDLAPRMERWTSEQDVFAVHRIDEQLAKALDRKVWLPSGGSLVIDRTEAMVVVDVNTGKFTGSGGNLEETVTRNNMEAAEEIVRQLRLRDLGGIIVIDFIDMVLESNRDLVMRRLLECLGRDRTKHQVAEVTSLGLVQMTRKRVGQGLLEAFSETCDKCNGRGVLVHMEPVQSGSGHVHDDGGQHGRRGAARGERSDRAEAAAEAAAGTRTAERAGEDEHDHEPHETGRRRKRRKSHGHLERQQHFDPQYDLDGVPEDFQDFVADEADAGPVTVSRRRAKAAAGADAPADRGVEVSQDSQVDHVPDHRHEVAEVVTLGDVLEAEEHSGDDHARVFPDADGADGAQGDGGDGSAAADGEAAERPRRTVRTRSARRATSSGTVTAGTGGTSAAGTASTGGTAGTGTSSTAAGAEHSPAPEVAGESGGFPVGAATAVATAESEAAVEAALGGAGSTAVGGDTAAAKRGVRVRRAAKRPAGPPASHS